MIFYIATKQEFLKDIDNGANANGFAKTISEICEQRTGKKPFGKEIKAWQTSLPAMAEILKETSIPDNTEILIEYEIPNTKGKRHVDFIIVGNYGFEDVIVIIELKAWDYKFANSPDPKTGDIRYYIKWLPGQISGYRKKLERQLEIIKNKDGLEYETIPCVYWLCQWFCALSNFATWYELA